MSNLIKIFGSKEFEGFIIAFFFHALFLILLSALFAEKENKKTAITIQSSIVENDTIVENKVVEIDEIKKFDEDTISVVDFNPAVENSSLEIENLEPPTVVEVNSDISLDQPELISDTFSKMSNNIKVSVSNQSSTQGALDRLTLEIVNNAETKDLTVAWLFDASISLNNQRQQIYNRFDKILKEIELSYHKKEISHTICYFGESFNIVTENPSNNIESLKKDILSIKLDESGIENTFNAIDQTCKIYNKNNSRLMIIVFTDEVGDDMSLLDTVAKNARSKGSMVYVIGSPAPFGKSHTQFKFVEFDPSYENSEKWVEICQGPETLYDLVLNLNSLPVDEEVLDSGFGPFALSKLCSDTGGLFFSIHPNRNNKKNSRKDIDPLSSYISIFFDNNIMKDYKPDYRSIAAQNKENTNIAKQSLIKACEIPLTISGQQTLKFRALNEGDFAEQLSLAQRFSAKLEPKINEVYNILHLGESASKNLEDKRWLASYNLAMGRILATKCRIESYNLILAEAKGGLKKKDTKSNFWNLIPSKEFNINNSNIKKNYDSAQKYLRHIVENFPGTPWALIAQEELNTPMGYIWEEDYQEPPKNKNNNANNNKPQEENKPKLVPKPQRKIGKI
jgi:hypothetical protein